ncbi:DUF3303 family protein [Actinokineospora inagensis]|uniref:DUF3303 family protein n=1 Tax=Actinokineospora inagensis TaxID=103730 RepID=UPI0004011433|nr:DUF3303 family protein [Actinokineospora inagensis]
MWWYCGYKALPGVRVGELAKRFLSRHDAGSNRPSEVRAWFGFPSGTAGFVLVEVDSPKELAAVLDPYARLVEWDVQAVFEINYNQVLEELRRSTQHAAIEDMMSGLPPAGVGAR